MAGAIAISTGYRHTVVLKTDGTVWATGKASSGQLGGGTTTNRDTFAAATGMTDVIAISAGGNHTVVLKTDGTGPQE